MMEKDAQAIEKSAVNPIIHGVIWKQLLFYFAPLLASSLLQLLYNTADTIIVGRYVGKIALTAVGGSAGQIYGMVTEFMIGASSGAAVLLSQAYGARDRKLLDDGIHNAAALALAMGALFMVIGIAASRAALTAAGVPDETLAESLLYLRIAFAGLIPCAFYNMGASALRAVGDSKSPLRFLVISCGLNIVLDLLFVAVLHLGIGGAALATVLTQTLSAVLVLRALIRGKGKAPLDLRRIRLQKRVASKMLWLGIPLGLETLMYTFTCVVLTSAVNTFGTDTVAAYAGFVRIDSFYWILEQAFAVSITVFVGQNLGAGRMDRVHGAARQGAVLMYLFMGAAIVFMYTGCRVWLGLFTKDPQVLEIGVSMMRYLLPFYILYVPNGVFFSTLRGMGDTLRPTLITFMGVCVIRILWVLLVFPRFPSVNVLLQCFPVSWGATAVIYAVYYQWYMRSRRRSDLIGQGGVQP